MTGSELDILMSKILMDSLKSEVESVEEEPPSFVASYRHQGQIRAMLKNPLSWAKKRSWPLWEKVLRRVAVAVLVIIISFGSVLAFSPTARAAVIQWVVEWYETHIVYRYFGEALDGEMPHFDITGLGKEYTETERFVSDQAVNVLYENEKGDIVCFDYNYLYDGSIGIFEFNDDQVIDVTINESSGLLFVPDDPEAMLAITWIDEQANMQFTIIANLDKNEMIRIAESVRKNNP